MTVSISSFENLGPHILPHKQLPRGQILKPWLPVDAEFNSVHSQPQIFERGDRDDHFALCLSSLAALNKKL